MVLFLRCNEVVFDSRAMKYLKFYRNKNIDFRIIGWDRQGNAHGAPEDSIYFMRRAGFNVGGFTAMINRILWMLFLIKTLVRNCKKGDILHACDLDCAFPAVIYKLLFNRKVRVIFDVFDWYSSLMSTQPGFILFFFKWMERMSVRFSNHIIICEPERREQIPFDFPEEKMSILPNIPYFDDTSFLKQDKEYRFDNGKVTFTYVGTFSWERYLDEIITLAEEGIINLNIAGYGETAIMDRLEKVKDLPNIRYYGKVDYQKAQIIMYNSDVIYAMYASVSPNNVFAAPNKYYEAMFLGKPLFTNSGTIVEKKIRENGTGFICDESLDSIKTAVEGIKMDEALVMGEKAHVLWYSKFATYTSEYLKNVYSKMIS